MAKLKFFGLLVLFTFCAFLNGCKKTDANTVLFMKIINSTGSNIAVVSLPNGIHKEFKGEEITTDFGSIPPGESSPYRRVSNAFLITVNATAFSNSSGTIKFVISNPPSTQWSLNITSQAGGVHILKAD